jgi:hypothetical protein
VATIAPSRASDWDFPLFLHVLGAMVLVGALVLALGYLASAWRGKSADSLRVGFRVLLYGAFPGYIVMRVAAQWIYSKEGLDSASLTWADIGFITSEGGLFFMIVATVAAGLALRRAARSSDLGGGARVAAVLVSLLIAVYVVSIWAMTTKPV